MCRYVTCSCRLYMYIHMYMYMHMLLDEDIQVHVYTVKKFQYYWCQLGFSPPPLPPVRRAHVPGTCMSIYMYMHLEVLTHML